MNEHDVQNRIRVAISQYGKYFRINSGTGWTSNDTRRISVAGNYALEPGDMVLKNARTFSTGTPPGYTDLSGVTPIVITQEIVGKKIGVATFLEIKGPGGKLSPDQFNFIGVMRDAGAIAGVARSEEDAIDILGVAGR